MMRRFTSFLKRPPRFRGLSTVLALPQAYLSRQVHQAQQVAPGECHLVLRLHALQGAAQRQPQQPQQGAAQREQQAPKHGQEKGDQQGGERNK
jgi:hypothetical protein